MVVKRVQHKNHTVAFCVCNVNLHYIEIAFAHSRSIPYNSGKGFGGQE